MRVPSGSELISAIIPLTSLWKRIDVSQEPTATIWVPGGTNKCLDAADNRIGNGGRWQIWDAHGGANQQLKLKDNRIVIGSNFCMDLPEGKAYNGAAVGMWQCSDNNKNQVFVPRANNMIEFGSSGFCLNRKDGGRANGTPLQVWQCNTNDPNFKWDITTVARATQPQPQPPQQNTGGGGTSTGAGNFYGLSVISFDDMCRRFPQIAQNRAPIAAAAADQRIHPTFLAAICMQESTCSPTYNGFGYFQFSDWNAWLKYGAGGDRNSIWDSSYASARYYRDLIDSNNGNVYAAMNGYSGSWPGYTDGIAAWTSGYTPKTHQRRAEKGYAGNLQAHKNHKRKRLHDHDAPGHEHQL
jgi:hypothetical protein